MCDDGTVRRQLLLVRHAKSSWDDTSLPDRDRPLAARGIKALAGMRDYLQRSEHRPEIVLCSPSRRTIDTFDSIRAAIPMHAQVVLADELYGATADSLLDLLRGVDDGIECAMVVGHNPTLQDLALLLVGAGDADVRGQLATKIPTGAVVTMSFDGAWADLDDGVTALNDLYMPRPPRS